MVQLPRSRKHNHSEYSTAFLILSSETTQCVVIYSRQGTTDTIEEVEDEQDQGEDKQQVEPQQFQECPEEEPWSDGEPREKQYEEEESPQREEGEEGPREEEALEDQERGGTPSTPLSPDEGPSLRVEEAESAPSALENDFITESDDGGDHQDFMRTEEGPAGPLYTPDTDVSKTSDAEVPPSYSKAVSFDRLEVSDDDSDMDRKRHMIMTSDSRSDSRSDIVLPSMTTELTASELLLNK